MLPQLAKIIASAEESDSFWQRKDYKAFSPSVDWDNVDWDAGGRWGREQGGAGWVEGRVCPEGLAAPASPAP